MTLVRFALVGVSNTIVTLVSYALLVRMGAPHPAASAAGFLLGAANGYRLNRAWTFRSSRRGPATVSRYVAVQGLGALLSAVGIGLAGSEVVVLPFVTAVTYLLSRHLVFGGPRTA